MGPELAELYTSALQLWVDDPTFRIYDKRLTNTSPSSTPILPVKLVISCCCFDVHPSDIRLIHQLPIRGFADIRISGLVSGAGA